MKAARWMLWTGVMISGSTRAPTGVAQARALEASQPVTAARLSDSDRDALFDDARKSLADGARDANELLTDRRFDPLRPEARFRPMIREHSTGPRAILVSPDEPGEPMVVSGMVRDADGRPVAGAEVYVFHADARGRYTPDRPMNEPQSRLFAYITNGPDGRYEFRTVRPGAYRQPRGEESWIPQHIHYEVAALGFKERRFQLVFADDPRMTPYWRKWAREGGHAITMATITPDGAKACVYDIALERN